LFIEIVMDHQKRIDIVKRDNLYFNCLAHHKVLQYQYLTNHVLVSYYTKSPYLLWTFLHTVLLTGLYVYLL